NVSEVKAGLRELETQLTMLHAQVRDLGFEEPLETTPEAIEDATKIKSGLEKELAEIGLVNQLAVQHYEEIKDGYKHLSVRIGDLEREKLAILDFMNELEKRKLDTFMGAFTKVNDTFHQIFSDITNGGNGRMALDRPDNPFEGGLDVFLRSPGKTELTSGTASGGENPGSSCCYLLALQQIHIIPSHIIAALDT